MIIEACLFINQDDCTKLKWCKSEDDDTFDALLGEGWLYVGMFDIEAGKIHGMYLSEKSWVRKAVRNE